MNVFAFVVRRLHFLGAIPGAPHLFDALLVGWSAIRHPARLWAMETLEAALVARPGVTLRVHRLGGVGFAIAGEEFAHLHGNGLFDIRAGRELAQRWIAERLAEPHHVLGDGTAWVSYWICSESDVPVALELAEKAALQNRRQSSDFEREGALGA